MADAYTSENAHVLSLDFVSNFDESINGFLNILNATDVRVIPDGSNIKVWEITGDLEDGNVPEGEPVPFSKYKVTEKYTIESEVKDWATAASEREIQ